MSKIVKSIDELDFTTDKASIVKMGEEHAAAIINGDQADVVKSYILIKRYELYVKTLIDELKAETTKKILETESKDFEFGTATAVLTKRRKFDFSNDDYWKGLAEKSKVAADQKKSHEAKLKEMTEGSVAEIVDEESGEVVTIHAPTVEFSQTLMVKIS